MGVEQTVQGFGALGEFGEVAFLQRFGERVEQAPDIATLKGIMTRLTPFVENRRDESIGAHSNIGGANDKVMGFDVGDLGFLVGGDAFVLIMPFGKQEADGASDQLRQITHDEPGVFAGELDLSGEGKVIAHKHAGPGDDAGGEGLVMAVTQSKNPAIILTGFLGMNLHETEVALAFVRQRMRLGTDAQIGGAQCLLDGGDELMVGDGTPAFCGTWRGHSANFVELHMGGSTMEHEVGCLAADDKCLGIEIGNHRGGFFLG